MTAGDPVKKDGSTPTGNRPDADSLSTTGTGPAADALAEYRRRRDFTRTSEPSGSGDAPESDHGVGGEVDEDTLPERPAFVVQKHAASTLHYDLRLEMGGVLKSWAVPKGPSLDPTDKRLAVRTEDHPLEYAIFEGTIPEEEYGGGTVMVWDFGWWEPDFAWMDESKKGKRRKSAGSAESPEPTESARPADSGLKKGAPGSETLDPEGFDPEASIAGGDLKFIIHGQKLTGSWALVQMKNRGEKNWLLLKHRDEDARPGTSIVEEAPDSVATGRSLEQIAADEIDGKGTT